MVSRHFYDENGAYSKDEFDKQNIAELSQAINDFIYPIYDKYRKLGYPGAEISQLIDDQLEYGIIHYRLAMSAKEAMLKKEENKASD